MSESTRILSDDEILNRRDRNAFEGGFSAGVEAALEILDNYSDVIDGPDGSPMPNHAMRYMQEIKEALMGVQP